MANKMKAKQSENNFKATLSQILGRNTRRQVSLLALNVWAFNFSDGWRRTLSRHESARFYT
jgi:hypothetical protein